MRTTTRDLIEAAWRAERKLLDAEFEKRTDTQLDAGASLSSRDIDDLCNAKTKAIKAQNRHFNAAYRVLFGNTDREFVSDILE